MFGKLLIVKNLREGTTHYPKTAETLLVIFYFHHRPVTMFLDISWTHTSFDDMFWYAHGISDSLIYCRVRQHWWLDVECHITDSTRIACNSSKPKYDNVVAKVATAILHTTISRNLDGSVTKHYKKNHYQYVMQPRPLQGYIVERLYLSQHYSL